MENDKDLNEIEISETSEDYEELKKYIQATNENDTKNRVEKLLEKHVVKANDLVRRSRYSLSLLEQKILLYIIAQVDSFDDEFEPYYKIRVKEFCQICGMDYKSGRAYSVVKEAVLGLKCKYVLISKDDGEEVTLDWVTKVRMWKKSGLILVKLDKDMKPYLLQLKQKFTRYELINVLRFHSKYALRLYEYLESWIDPSYEVNCCNFTFSLDEVKERMGAEQYGQWKDFKRRALDPAVKEICKHSDIQLSYKPEKDVQTITGLSFYVQKKEAKERLDARRVIEQALGFDEDGCREEGYPDDLDGISRIDVPTTKKQLAKIG